MAIAGGSSRTGVRAEGVDMQPYLRHAIAATFSVFGIPAAIVLAMVVVADPDPPVALISLVSIVLSSAASVVGANVWSRDPASIEVSFGDLMLWGWWKRRRAEDKLERSTRLLGLDRSGQPVEGAVLTRERQLKVLHELNDALEAKDPYTRGHSERVERHVYRTAAAMGLSVHDLQELRMAAALHDIGKIRVPDRIIRKPGALTPEERSMMEEHSVVGAWMLSHVATTDVIEAVRYHHERWDGKGYPDGVAGTDIPLYARIIAVCDTFDAITSTRPYRAKSERERAIEVLKEERGRQFDPLAVDAFLSALPAKLPIAAVALMLPGLGRVVRELAVAFRRAGAVSLAGATTAASASVVIAAATLVPAIERLPVPASSFAAGAAEDGSAATAADGAAPVAAAGRVARAGAGGADDRFSDPRSLSRRAAFVAAKGLDGSGDGEGDVDDTGGAELDPGAAGEPGPQPPATVLETGPGESEAALDNASDAAASKGKSEAGDGAGKSSAAPGKTKAGGNGKSGGTAPGKPSGTPGGGSGGGNTSPGSPGGGNAAPGTGGTPGGGNVNPGTPGGGNPAPPGGGNANPSTPGGGNPDPGRPDNGAGGSSGAQP